MLLSTYSQRKWVWTQVYPPFETLNLKLAGLLAGSLFLFLGIFIFGTIRRNRKQKLLLLFLTLSIVLQIDYILFYKELPDLFVNIWMGLPTVFGPLTLLYVQSLIRRKGDFEPSEFINYIPFLLVAVLAFVPSLKIHQNYTFQVMVTVVHWGTFLLYMYVWLWQSKTSLRSLGKKDQVWLWALVVLISVIWLNQSLLFLLRERYEVTYTGLLVLAAVLVSFFYFRYRNHPEESENYSDHEKQKVSEITEVPSNHSFYINKLSSLLDQEKVYLDPNLTLPRLAEKLQVQPYLLSQIINSHYHQSFPDFINTFRVEDAKALLEDGNLKISSIAVDCGFNTLSSFNLAFKKQTRKTPSEFRNQLSVK